MKIKEFNKLTEEELRKREVELRKELVSLRAQIRAGAQGKHATQIRNTRKNIARVLTSLQQKSVIKNKKEDTQSSIKQ